MSSCDGTDTLGTQGRGREPEQFIPALRPEPALNTRSVKPRDLPWGLPGDQDPPEHVGPARWRVRVNSCAAPRPRLARREERTRVLRRIASAEPARSTRIRV